MMRRQDAQHPLYCVLDREERVPPGHPLRRVAAAVDFYVRAWNSSEVRRRGRPNGPRISKLQEERAVRGVGPAESTGKSSVTYCPGGPTFAGHLFDAR